MRASERSITHRKEQSVLAFPKIYQKVKSINIMKNLHQLNSSGQNSQLASNGSNPKFKSTKSLNQKIQPKLIGMLHPDSSHMQEYTKTHNKGLEKDLPTKWRAKINK